MSAFILAIDLGSTSFKASLFDGALIRLCESSVLAEYLRPAEGRIELPAEAAIDLLGRVIRDLLRTAGLSGSEISAIAITSQAQTFTVLSAEGTPRRPFISWMDVRAVKTANRAIEENLFADIGEHASYGSPLPNLALFLLRHLRDEQPTLLAQGDEIAFLPGFVVHALTGRNSVDENLAGMSGLYSLKEQGWWPKALDYCCLEASQLPNLCRMGSIVARTSDAARRFGLAEEIPVILAGNDQTAGAYAADIHNNGALLITLGTAYVAYICLERMPPPSACLFRGPYPGGLFYRMAADTGGGALIGRACTELGTEVERFFQLAFAASAGCGGVRFRPVVSTSKGRWEGVSEGTTDGDFARSVLECLLERIVEMVESLEVDLAGHPILLAGGGRQSSFWRDALRERFRTTVEVVDADPLLSAARLALQAL